MCLENNLWHLHDGPGYLFCLVRVMLYLNYFLLNKQHKFQGINLVPKALKIACFTFAAKVLRRQELSLITPDSVLSLTASESILKYTLETNTIYGLNLSDKRQIYFTATEDVDTRSDNMRGLQLLHEA